MACRLCLEGSLGVICPHATSRRPHLAPIEKPEVVGGIVRKILDSPMRQELLCCTAAVSRKRRAESSASTSG